MLNQRLKELICILGLKQNEFAKKIGFSPSYVNKLIKNYNLEPSVHFFNSLKQFNVNIEWLKHGVGEPIIKKCDIDYEIFLNKVKELDENDKELIIKLTDTLYRKQRE